MVVISDIVSHFCSSYSRFLLVSILIDFYGVGVRASLSLMAYTLLMLRLVVVMVMVMIMILVMVIVMVMVMMMVMGMVMVMLVMIMRIMIINEASGGREHLSHYCQSCVAFSIRCKTLYIALNKGKC